jgi:arginine/lysine/ornithine decarboxylase
MKQVCGDRLFIVDEAHGAHFYFSKEKESVFPKPALIGCADAAVTSIHKTLGGISGTAFINVSNESRLDIKKLKM